MSKLSEFIQAAVVVWGGSIAMLILVHYAFVARDLLMGLR